MKKRNIAIAVVCLGNIAFGQGSLTPPGAPAPSMKTLQQVEPRIPISSAPAFLDEPGSYYLTQNLDGTVTIDADNITLDLMGFAINAASGNGVSLNHSGIKNTRVHNGIISAPQANGIDFSVSSPDANGCIENLRIYDCLYSGIAIGSGFVVRNVSVRGAQASAISAGGDSHILNCILTKSSVGLELTGSKAWVENNRVWGNTDNYSLSQGNQLNLLLCEVPETLDWPCSVRFSGTLVCTNTATNGIVVAANNVTIDMDGHTLVGPGTASTDGIYQYAYYHNLHISNGKVENWRGTGTERAGLFLEGNGVILSDVQATSNGVGITIAQGGCIENCSACKNESTGIDAESGCTLSKCSAFDNGGDGIRVTKANTLSGCSACNNTYNGIYASDGNTFSECTADNNLKGFQAADSCSIINSTASNNKQGGIRVGDGSTISGCTVFQNISGDGLYSATGIVAGKGSTVSGCSSYSNDSGIFAGDGSAIFDCTVSHNSDGGIQISSDTRVANCICHDNSQGNLSDVSGILATGYDNRIENNTCTDNDYGIKVDSNGNIVIKNTASGNTTNYQIDSGSHYRISTSLTGAEPWDNFEF